MPVVERRRVTYTRDGRGDVILHLPRGWADMFGQPREVDIIVDTPVVAFAPVVRTNRQKIEALRKIIQILKAVPDSPYPRARRGRRSLAPRLQPARKAQVPGRYRHPLAQLGRRLPRHHRPLASRAHSQR